MSEFEVTVRSYEHITVEADNLDEAMKKAEEKSKYNEAVHGDKIPE